MLGNVSKRRVTRATLATFAAANVLACGPAAADSGPPFYPAPIPTPPRVTAGKLVGFYVGNKPGGGVIRTTAGRSVRFNITHPFVVNGMTTMWVVPPRVGLSAPPATGDVWPSDVVIGRSRVRMYYTDIPNLLVKTVHVAGRVSAL